MDALLAIDQVRAVHVLQEGLAAGASPLALAEQCVTPALEAVGDGWERGELSLSQIYMAGRIAEAAVEAIFPSPAILRPDAPVIGLALLEDFHALGKRMVQLVLRAAGYGIRDLGRVTAEELASRVLQERFDLVLVSTLMLRSALRVREVKERLLRAGNAVPVCVGGAPFRFDPDLWREVGADGFGMNASDAVRLAAQFRGGRP